MIVRRAGDADVELVESMIIEASDWLTDRGLVWMGNPPGPVPERVSAGSTWLAYLDSGDAVATVALDTHADPDFWTAEGDDALFVHSLTVRRAAAGRSVGTCLLDFADYQAVQHGLPWVRLECVKANERLQAYYRDVGFTHLRTVDLPHRNNGALFERPVRMPSTVRPDDELGDRFWIDCG